MAYNIKRRYHIKYGIASVCIKIPISKRKQGKNFIKITQKREKNVKKRKLHNRRDYAHLWMAYFMRFMATNLSMPQPRIVLVACLLAVFAGLSADFTSVGVAFALVCAAFCRCCLCSFCCRRSGNNLGVGFLFVSWHSGYPP